MNTLNMKENIFCSSEIRPIKVHILSFLKIICDKLFQMLTMQSKQRKLIIFPIIINNNKESVLTERIIHIINLNCQFKHYTQEIIFNSLVYSASSSKCILTFFFATAHHTCNI